MDETLKRRAYLEGLKLMKEGLDIEIVYARLEKQGFPHELVIEVVEAVSEERTNKATVSLNEQYYISLIILLAGIGTAVLSVIYSPGITIIPIGFIVMGIIGLRRSSRT